MHRITSEIGPTLPEQFVFSPDEADIAARAVAHRLDSRLRSPESMWSPKSRFYFESRTDNIAQGMTEIEQIVGDHRRLADRILDDASAQPPRATEFLVPEIYMLGQSLYGFGVHGLAHAVASTRNGSVPYVLGRQDERLTDQRAFIEMGEQAYALYKEIEPIALAKEAIAWRWLKWEGVAQGPHYEGTLRDSVAPDHST